MLEYKLRLAKAEDLDQILPVIRAAHQELPSGLPFSRERVKSVLHDVLSQGVIICLATENIHGVFIAIKTLTPTSLEPIAAELLWYVEKDHRKSRRALELVDAFEYWARSQGCKGAVIGNMTNNSFDKTHRFYLRRGYILSEQSYFKELI